MSSQRCHIPAVLALLAGAALALAVPSAASAARTVCTRVAAPSGSDHARGTVRRPFRTPQRLLRSLRPGDTGCLRAGTYAQEVDGPFVLNFHRAGRRGAPITMRSYPGERARLRGIITVARGADHVVISGFDIDGRRPSGSDNPISIQLMAARTVLRNNRITNPIGSCLALGVPGWGTARGAVIRDNVFHDCGTTRNGIHDHAIYASDAVGGRIVDNVFLRTATFAVHFYGRNAGVLVAHNVMEDNGGGVIFSSYGADTATGNVVERNVIADSVARPGVQSWWGGLPGFGNVVRDNCVSRSAGRDIDTTNGGFVTSGNVHADPRFLDAAAGDLRLAANSACLDVVGYDTVARVAARGT